MVDVKGRGYLSSLLVWWASLSCHFISFKSIFVNVLVMKCLYGSFHTKAIQSWWTIRDKNAKWDIYEPFWKLKLLKVDPSYL